MLIFQTSFFTILSNILAAFNSKKEGINYGFFGSRMAIITAAYISITCCLIYNLALLPVDLSTKGVSAYEWSHKILAHSVFPIIYVVYVVGIMKHNNVETWTYKWKSQTWVYAIIGLFGYCSYALIRGFIRLGTGFADNIYSFPYFFLQVAHLNPIASINVSRIAWFFIVPVLIVIIIIGFSSLYIFIIKKRMHNLKHQK